MSRPGIISTALSLRGMGLVRAAEQCDGGILVAADFVALLDRKLQLVRPAWSPAKPANVRDLSLFVRKDCSGYLLTRDWGDSMNVYHLNALNGGSRRDFALKRQGYACFANHHGEPWIVKAEDNVGTMTYSALTGAPDRHISDTAPSDLITGDLTGDGDSEIVLIEHDDVVIRGLDGSVLGSIVGPIRSVALGDGYGSTNDCIIVQRSETVEAFDVMGRLVGRYQLPRLEQFSFVVAAARTDRALAIVLGGRGGWHRTILLLYEAGGDLARYEVLDGDFLVVKALNNREFAVFGRERALTVSGL